MTRAAAAAALGSGWRHLPLRDLELRYTLAPPSPAAHVHARGLALSCGCSCCWVAAAVGFTRRSLTRGRARDFSHKAFFSLSFFFFSFAKLTFTPFHFSSVVSIPPGLLVLLLHSSLFSRLVGVLGFGWWFSPLVAAVPKEEKGAAAGGSERFSDVVIGEVPLARALFFSLSIST